MLIEWVSVTEPDADGVTLAELLTETVPVLLDVADSVLDGVALWVIDVVRLMVIVKDGTDVTVKDFTLDMEFDLLAVRLPETDGCNDGDTLADKVIERETEGVSLRVALLDGDRVAVGSDVCVALNVSLRDRVRDGVTESDADAERDSLLVTDTVRELVPWCEKLRVHEGSREKVGVTVNVADLDDVGDKLMLGLVLFEIDDDIDDDRVMLPDTDLLAVDDVDMVLVRLTLAVEDIDRDTVALLERDNVNSSVTLIDSVTDRVGCGVRVGG